MGDYDKPGYRQFGNADGNAMCTVDNGFKDIQSFEYTQGRFHVYARNCKA
jgi:hypothetical protein